MNILAFGEVLYDVFPDQKHIGGAPMNFAAHAARQGANSFLVSAVGRDALGRDALREMAALGIDTALVGEVDAPTGSCLVTFGADGAPRYDLQSGVAYDEIPLPQEKLRADCLYFGTLSLRSPKNKQTLLRLLSSHPEATVFADVNVRPPHTSADSLRFAFAHAHILKISREELPTVLSAVLPSADPTEEGALAALALAYPHVRLWVLTCDKDGARARTRDGKEFFTPAVPTTVRSSVGAGDSFSAALLTACLRGKPIESALRFAARVAAYVVSHVEAVPEGIPTE